MGERRSRTLRRVPSTQATSPSPRVSKPVQVLGQVHGGLQGPRLAAGAVGVGRGPLVLGEERALCPAAAQRVGDAPADLGTAAEQLGQLAVVHGRPGLVVQDARPDPIAEERAELVADRRQGIEQIGVAGLDERPGGGHERTEPARGHLDPEARRHDLLELVRLVEDDHVVLGEHHAAAGQVRPVEVGVDHDDIGHRGPLAGRLGEAATTGRAVEGARALPWADADHVPGPVGGLEAQVGPVAAAATSATRPRAGALPRRCLRAPPHRPPSSRSPRPVPARRPGRPGRRARPESHPSPPRPPAGGRRSCSVP